MKKIFLFMGFAILMSSSILAQQKGKERIKAYKTAYITQELDLTPKQAELFWPVYNKYDQILFELKVEKTKKARARIREIGGPDALSNEEALSILNEMLSTEIEVGKTKEAMFNELSEVMEPQILLKLYHAERNFNKKLLSEYRKGKSGPK